MCYIKECDRINHARGLCEMHYRRVLRSGVVGESKPKRESRRILKGSNEQRFWRNIEKIKDCLVWLGAKTTAGYGEFQINKRTVYAHRWSYENFIGIIPEGLFIDHLCKNKSCVNPYHLEPVTNAENIKRGLEKEFCKYGHKKSISKSGKRVCYICHRERDKKRWPKRYLARKAKLNAV